MSDMYETILEQALMALESLQALNDNDMKNLVTIASPERLETCARQLTKLIKPLDCYRADLIGTATHLGIISGIKKNNKKQVTHYKIRNNQGNHWLTVEEFKQVVKHKPVNTHIPVTNQ